MYHMLRNRGRFHVGNIKPPPIAINNKRNPMARVQPFPGFGRILDFLGVCWNAFGEGFNRFANFTTCFAQFIQIAGHFGVIS